MVRFQTKVPAHLHRNYSPVHHSNSLEFLTLNSSAIALAMLVLCLSEASGTDIAEIRQRAAESLRLRETGDLEYELSFGHLNGGSHEIEWKPAHCRDHMIFDRRDGRHIYLKRWTPHEATLLRDGQALTRKNSTGGSFQKLIVRPDRLFEYYSDALSDSSYLPINEDIPENDPLELRAPFNAWNFGLIPDVFESGNDYSFESLTASPGGKSPKIHQEQVNGDNCWKVEYHPDDNRTVYVWYAAEKDCSVVRVMMEGSHKLWAWRNTLDSELAMYPEGGVWYPSEVILRSERVGSTDPAHLILERIRVIRASFNIEVPAEQFTVKALAPAPHVRIVRRFESDLPPEEWDGEKVAAITQPNPMPPPAVWKSGWSRRTIYILLGNLFFLTGIGLWCLRRVRRSRNSAT